MSGETDVAKPDSADVAGADGLKVLAREKSRKAIPVPMSRLQAMLSDTREALEPYFAGKKVARGALVKKLEHPARRARAELQSLAVFVEPYSEGDTWRVYPVQFPSGSRWADVSSILYKLGGHEDWPDADELGTWLASEVLPALEFAVGTKPSKVANALE